MQRRRRILWGSTPFKELTHWGHAHIQAHHLQLDPTQCELQVQPTKIVIGHQVMVRFRIVWDAGNPTYGGLLDDGEWEQLAGLRHDKNETRGDLLEFLMFFGCMGPFYPAALGHWVTGIVQRLHRDISDMSMGRATLADGWRQRAPARMNLAEQERKARAQVLEGGVMPIGMRTATQPLRALEDQRHEAPTAGTETEAAAAAPQEASTPQAPATKQEAETITTKVEPEKEPTSTGATRALAPVKMETQNETSNAPGSTSAGAVRAVEQLDHKPNSLFGDPQETAAAATVNNTNESNNELSTAPYPPPARDPQAARAATSGSWQNTYGSGEIGSGGLPHKFSDGDCEVDYDPVESAHQRVEEDATRDRAGTEAPNNDVEAIKALAAEALREAQADMTKLMEEAMSKLVDRMSIGGAGGEAAAAGAHISESAGNENTQEQPKREYGDGCARYNPGNWNGAGDEWRNLVVVGGDLPGESWFCEVPTKRANTNNIFGIETVYDKEAFMNWARDLQWQVPGEAETSYDTLKMAKAQMGVFVNLSLMSWVRRKVGCRRWTR